MFNLRKETLLLTQIAACIASDNFKLLEKKISLYRKYAYDPIKLYEAILQSYLFCGFPAAIESLNLFRKYYIKFKPDEANYNVHKFKNTGVNNCKLIYKKNFKKLIENMNELSPDLMNWMLIEGYGKVLGRKNLDLRNRELINVSFLCTHYYESQLHSHMRGCINLDLSSKTIYKVLNNLRSISGEKNINKAKKLLSKITDNLA